MEAGRDYQMIQTGGAPEMFAALLSGAIDAGPMSSPWDARALSAGYGYVVYGPDLRIPQVAVSLITRRSFIAQNAPLVGRFMRAMAEAAKILHTDKEIVFRVLAKYLRIEDRKVLDQAYNAEIKALEPRLELRLEAVQAILDDVAANDPRAKKFKPQDLHDRRYLDEMEKSGFMDKLWAAGNPR
jgi:ABC-type nitrate/sulfonate/bicarbonate transport system substrate-binding protein